MGPNETAGREQAKRDQGCRAPAYVPGFARDERVPKPREPRFCSALYLLHAAHQGVARAEVARQAEALLMTEDGKSDPDCAWLGLQALAYVGNLGRMEQHHDALAQDVRFASSSRHREVLALSRAHVALLTGDVTDVERLLLTPAIGRASSRSVLRLAVAWLVEAQVTLGELDRAQRLLAEHDLLDGFDTNETDGPHVLAARGSLHTAAGRPRQAIEDLRACGRLLAALDVNNPAVIPWRSRAVPAALAAGRADLAVALAEDELAAARTWGSPRTIGTALHAVALARRDARAPALLEEAVELLDLAHARTEQLRALHDLSTILAAQGDPTAARRALESALIVARRSGNRSRPGHLGSATPRARDAAVRLTRQELKIARLARAGYTNKRIAETLYLTVRTVEFHLSGAYRKLGITGRRELADALDR